MKNFFKNKRSQDPMKYSAEEVQEIIEKLEKEVEDLRSQLDTAKREREEYREISVRKVAELENFRRRSEQEKQEISAYSGAKLLGKIISVLDDLKRAVDAAHKSSDYQSLLSGVQLVLTNTEKSFMDAGLKVIKTVGENFDVNLHEALMHIPNELPEGKIVQEVQSGYLYQERVVRHAKVITSAGLPQQESTTSAPDSAHVTEKIADNSTEKGSENATDNSSDAAGHQAQDTHKVHHAQSKYDQDKAHGKVIDKQA